MSLFEPMTVTPEQGLFQGARTAESGEARLLGAVLLDAVQQLSKPRQTPRDQRLFSEAVAWVDGECESQLPFALCCAALHLDPDYVRRGLQKHINAASKPPAFQCASNWRVLFGRWGQRFVISRDGRVFDYKSEKYPPCRSDPEGMVRVDLWGGSSGSWPAPLSRLMARTWGGANRHVKVEYRDGNPRNCHWENLTWNTKKYSGSHFSGAEAHNGELDSSVKLSKQGASPTLVQYAVQV